MATNNNVNVNVNVKTQGLGELKQQSDLAKDSLEGLAGGLRLFGINTGILEQAAQAGDAAGKSFKSLGEASGTLKEGTLSLGGAMKTFFSILKANPIILVVTAALGLVEALKFLYGRVEIVTKAFNFLGEGLTIVKDNFLEFVGIQSQTDLEILTEGVDKLNKKIEETNTLLGRSKAVFDEQQKARKLQGATEIELKQKEIEQNKDYIATLKDLRYNSQYGTNTLIEKEKERAKLYAEGSEEQKKYNELLKKDAELFAEYQLLGLQNITKELELKELIAKKEEEEAKKRKERSEKEQKEADARIKKYIQTRLELDRLAEAGRAASADLTTSFELNTLTTDDSILNKSVWDRVNKDVEEGNKKLYEKITASINAINQVAGAALNEYGQFVSDNFAQQLETLNGELTSINDAITEQQNKYNESLSRSQELENGLANARGNRRKRLLEDIAQEKKAQEEAKKAELKLLSDQKKKEDEIRRKETEQKVAALKIETAALALQIGTLAALAIARHFAENIPKDPTFGITTIATGAALGIALAANVAKMRQLSKDVETFQDGGLITNGNSHANGGVKAQVNGGRMVELEGNEYIINKRSTAKYKGLLDRINSDKFADGGIVSPTNNTDLLSSLLTQPIYVAVTDINAAQSRVAKVVDTGRF